MSGCSSLASRTTRTRQSDGSRGLVQTLRHYRYPNEEEGQAGGDIPFKDGHYDHCADALRYGVINSLAIAGEEREDRESGIV